MSDVDQEVADAVAMLKARGWVVTPPSDARYGCHVELFAMEDDFEPDACVIYEGHRKDCIYASGIDCKEQCEYWRAWTPETLAAERRGSV